MRISSDQALAIRLTADTMLGKDARVILFGSRANDSLRGGDIDLLFETPKCLDNRAVTAGRIYAALIRALGDRKIDVILKDANTPEAPVMRLARETGVAL